MRLRGILTALREQKIEQIGEYDDLPVWGTGAKRTGFFAQPLWIQRLLIARRAQNKVTVLPILGPKGTGKTMTAFRVAEITDANQDFDCSHIAFTPSRVIDLADELEAGCVAVLDEAGIALPHREWQSAANRIFAKFGQSYRMRRGTQLSPDLIVTLPHLGLFDKVQRSLCDYAARMVNQGYARFYSINTDAFTGEYFPYTLAQLNNIKLPFSKTPEEMDQYDDMKKTVEEERTKDYRAILAADQDKAKGVWMKSRDPAAIVADLVENGIPRSLLKRNGKVDASLIAYEFRVPMSKAYIVKRVLESKLPDLSIVDDAPLSEDDAR